MSEQRTAFLTADEEKSLFHGYAQNDERSTSRIVTAYMPLVKKVVYTYRKRLPNSALLTKEDLMQAGTEALLLAMSRFDPSLENRFGSFAPLFINGAIAEYIIKNSASVNLGTTLYRKLHQIKKMKDEAGDDAHLSASDSALVGVLNKNDISVSAPPVDDGGEQSGAGYQLADESVNTEQQVADKVDFAIIMRTMERAGLSERERVILNLRFLEDEKYTNEQIGDMLGVTHERVRQLQKSALLKIKDKLGV